VKRERVSPQALAERAFHIEMELAGHPVGKQDHYLAAFGGITCLDIEPDGRVHPTPLNISVETTEELRRRLVLYFTNVDRSANAVLSAQREATEVGDATVIDSLDVTKAIGLRIRDALEAGELDDVGALMHEHWENKKRRPGAISDSRIDHWYDTARRAGALGGKVVGAGGGGFVMLYCPPERRAAIRQAMTAEGLREMSYMFDFEGAKVMMNF
jgi:D-glycero-alpha-D-manno-heptose-7-phosphate kinase